METFERSVRESRAKFETVAAFKRALGVPLKQATRGTSARGGANDLVGGVGLGRSKGGAVRRLQDQKLDEQGRVVEIRPSPSQLNSAFLRPASPSSSSPASRAQAPGGSHWRRSLLRRSTWRSSAFSEPPGQPGWAVERRDGRAYSRRHRPRAPRRYAAATSTAACEHDLGSAARGVGACCARPAPRSPSTERSCSGCAARRSLASTRGFHRLVFRRGLRCDLRRRYDDRSWNEPRARRWPRRAKRRRHRRSRSQQIEVRRARRGSLELPVASRGGRPTSERTDRRPPRGRPRRRPRRARRRALRPGLRVRQRSPTVRAFATRFDLGARPVGSADCRQLASDSRPLLPVMAAVRRKSSLLLVAALTTSVGCGRHRATQTDCAPVLDRLVELELTESGYRDPIVRARWQADLRRRLSTDLERCRGLMVRNRLRRCLPTAKDAEDIAHQCLE